MSSNRALVFTSFQLLIIGLSLNDATPDEKIRNETAAIRWLQELEPKLSEVYSEASLAAWNYNVNLTEHNNQLQIEASLASSRFQKEFHRNASLFDWKTFKNPDLVRRFKKLTDIGWAALPDDDIKRINELKNKMGQIYSLAEICEKRPKTATNSGTEKNCYSQNPDLTRIAATSRDWDEQIWVWRGWRDETGKKTKTDYAEVVKLLNNAARLNGFKDNGDYWRSSYEMENFEAACEKLWNQVKPLYEQLHCYVRRKLMSHYLKNTKDFPKGRHIPAHLTGNFWAQTWNNILDLVTPFPNSSVLDITDILRNRGFNAERMFREADSFFQSLGLHPMPDEFWNHSMLEKPTDGRNVVCHASAWDFFNGRDFRIKQCTDVTGDYFVTTHHEMGHVQYYLLYRHQPVVYRKGANPGFHEAIGDVMALSVNTPEHMSTLRLLNKTVDNQETEMNFLMKQALEKVAFLPFGYLVDRWRWEVFGGRVTPENYNKYYWKLRCKLQGVSPPVPRSEEDFDAGAKFHIPHNTPYIRYFVSYIIQFQFHKALCSAAGHNGPLHKCDIYRSKAAGEKLRESLRLGSSKPWTEAMEKLTGDSRMDASALLEYFRPLHEWLKRENGNDTVGWEENCPPEAFVSGGGGSPPPPLLPLLPSLVAMSCAFVSRFI